MVEHMPLLSDVGEALVIYLHEDRCASASRRIFFANVGASHWFGGTGRNEEKNYRGSISP